MQKMKGEEEAEMTIGAIIFVVSLAIIYGVIFMRFMDYSTAMKESQDKIAAVNEAHRALSCLKGSAFVLESAPAQDKLDSCGITYDVCVKDLENGKTWLKCGMREPDHGIYFPIKDNGAIHMGELDVKA